MNKITIKTVLLFLCIFLGLLLAPYIINSIIWIVCIAIKSQSIPSIKTSEWNSLMAIALPSALTYLVLRQSEQQQKENEHLQIRMERLNEKMLQTELKSRIGFFLPIVDDKRADGRWIPHRYDLADGIELNHAGDDIVFVTEASYIFHEKRKFIIQDESICFIDKPSFSCYCVGVDLSDEDLKLPQIDIDIELCLKNSKGFQYKQIINLGFENDNGLAIINRFNMNLVEVPIDAD